MDTFLKFQVRLILCFIPAMLFSSMAFSQVVISSGDGIEVIRKSTEKRIFQNYIIVSAGLPQPTWTAVPMRPENLQPDMYRENEQLEVMNQGWFAGIGMMNKTSRFFEFGLLADYHQNSTPIAFAGQRSTSEWVYEMNRQSGYFTDVFSEDVDRTCEVIAIRIAARLKVPMGPVSIWGGGSIGTYSSTIRFGPRSSCTFLNCMSKTMIYPTCQAGIDVVFNNKEQKDAFSLTFFTDLFSPQIEERFLDTVIEGWAYSNEDGNDLINPLRFGISIGFHL